MIVKKEHARHLLALLESPNGHIDVSKLNERAILDLEAAALLRFATPATVELTYGGEMVAGALDKLVKSGAIEPVLRWPDGFRWIGSEILVMMESSRRSGKVSGLALPKLRERGLVSEVRQKDRKIHEWRLNEEAERILEAFEELEPQLKVDMELAHLLLTAPAGPTEATHFPFDDEQKERLEAMRLFAYSVPDGEIALFTGIGQGVIEVLRRGAAAPEGDVVDSLMLDLLADHYDGKAIEEMAKVQLEMMGYIDDDGTLTPAGEAAMELRALLKNRIQKRLFGFALAPEHVDTLKTIERLGEATAEAIRKEMVEKKVAEFRELKERYGRRLDQMPLKKRKILEAFMEAKEHMVWFERFFDLREYLYALEAFDLIENGADSEGKGVYRLTRTGEEVADELASRGSPVSSAAIKALKLGRRDFGVPNREWVAAARTQKLLGEFGPTASGEFYRDLSERIVRKPFMTRYEMDLFKSLPESGMTVPELLDVASDEEERRRLEEALDMLEARGFVEVLADGHIVETEAGKRMDAALSGVPSGFGAPVTPVIYRVVKAVAETGTLYEKERKIRLLPKQHKEAWRRSGLSPEQFEKGWIAAREAHYLGKNGVNEAGIDLLEAVEAMNP
ncbi:DUF505 domain-containing protein [Hydrogenimonas sp.]